MQLLALALGHVYNTVYAHSRTYSNFSSKGIKKDLAEE
jgi:hypothetical protein